MIETSNPKAYTPKLWVRVLGFSPPRNPTSLSSAVQPGKVLQDVSDRLAEFWVQGLGFSSRTCDNRDVQIMLEHASRSPTTFSQKGNLLMYPNCTITPPEPRTKRDQRLQAEAAPSLPNLLGKERHVVAASPAEVSTW